MRAWGITDPGLVRSQNQDTYKIVPFGRECVLAVVCDGMGGAKSGNIASRMAAEVFVDQVERSLRDTMSGAAMEDLLAEAAQMANHAVYEQAQENSQFSGMGTTLVAALVIGRQAVILHVGDSRAYGCRAGHIECLTRDHSVVELMVERGELAQEQAKRYPGKNLITRAIGTEPTVACDLRSLLLARDERLLLCTDGLSNELADQEILFEVMLGGEKETCCGRLLDIAKSRGAPDNVTVVLIAE